MGSTIRIQEMNWEEIKEKMETGTKTVLLPVRSTEQHGPHLQTGTDTMVAVALEEAAAQQAPALAAPPLWFGWSPHHMVLPGTITIRPEVLIELIYDVMASLTHHGFNAFVLINGHRIVNIAWLQIAAERAKRTLGVKVALFDPAYMSKEFVGKMGWGEIGHAEETEGSHMWYCYPELVKMERAKDNPHQHIPLYHVDPRYPGDTLCYVPSTVSEQEQTVLPMGGTSGQPGKASREGGKRYHEHLVRRLVEVIGRLQPERA